MSYGVRGGRLRETIQIQSYTEAQDAYGQAVKTWTTAHTVRAEVREQYESAEAENGGKYEGREVKRFTIRYVSGLTRAMRIVWNSTNYEIISISNHLERNRRMIIEAATNG